MAQLNYRVLKESGYNGYILNENLEEIALVKNYCGYDPDTNSFLQYEDIIGTKTIYNIYRYPFKSYEELIKDADKLLEQK